MDIPTLIHQPSSILSTFLYKQISQLIIHSVLVPSLTGEINRSELIENMKNQVKNFESKLRENSWNIDTSLQDCINGIESLWINRECSDLIKWIKQIVKDPSNFLKESIECGIVDEKVTNQGNFIFNLYSF